MWSPVEDFQILREVINNKLIVTRHEDITVLKEKVPPTCINLQVDLL